MLGFWYGGAVTLQRLGSHQKRIRSHPRCMMKQIIKHAVAKAVGKNIHMHPVALKNAEDNAVRHGLARRTKIFRVGEKFLTQSLKIFILG